MGILISGIFSWSRGMAGSGEEQRLVLEPVSADLLLAIETAAGEVGKEVAELIETLQSRVGEMTTTTAKLMETHGEGVDVASAAVDDLISAMEVLLTRTADLNTDMRVLPVVASRIAAIKSMLSTLEGAAGKVKAPLR